MNLFSRILEKYKCFNYINVVLGLIVLPYLADYLVENFKSPLTALINTFFVMFSFGHVVLIMFTLANWNLMIKAYRRDRSNSGFLVRVLPDPISWMCRIGLLKRDVVDRYEI